MAFLKGKPWRAAPFACLPCRALPSASCALLARDPQNISGSDPAEREGPNIHGRCWAQQLVYGTITITLTLQLVAVIVSEGGYHAIVVPGKKVSHVVIGVCDCIGAGSRTCLTGKLVTVIIPLIHSAAEIIKVPFLCMLQIYFFYCKKF